MKTKYLIFKVLGFLTLTSLIILVYCSRKIEKNEIVVCSWGGAFQDSQRKAYFIPFEEATGIKIREASYNAEYGEIKEIVDAKKVMWDVVDIKTSALLRGTQEGIFESINYRVVDSTNLFKEAIHAFGVSTDFFSTVLSYSTKAFNKETPHPQSWKDFWDVEKFPGPRSLRKDPQSTLEFALLADGITPDNLYPLDVERAFRSLDKIKDHINVWWVSGHQPVQLLADGEVIMTSAFNGRVWLAKNFDKIPIDFVWNQAVMNAEWWVILKGTKHKELAMKFIAFVSDAKRQATMAELIPYGPSNKEALKYVDINILKELPTYSENLRKQVIIDAEWWAENEAWVVEKWNQWLVKK